LVPLEMSTIDIEAPGADEAALKAAIQALVPISTTAISSPVNYVDITLPSGYSAYRLIGAGMYRSASNALPTMAFSQDGGTTWLEDYDTDYLAYIGHYATIKAAVAGVYSTSALIELGMFAPGGVSFRHHFDVLIFPGVASNKPAVSFTLTVNGTHETQTGLAIGRWVSNLSTARANAVRVMPEFLNPNAIDTGYLWNAGALSLYGVL
jgi:hypothetical protein